MGFFYILYVVICVLLIAVILFQDGKSGGIGAVPDASQSVFGAKGASNFLTKLTSVLSVIFLCLTMFLAYRGAPSESIAAGFESNTTSPGQLTDPNDKGRDLDAEIVGDTEGKIKETKIYDSAEDLPPEVRKQLGVDEKPAEKPAETDKKEEDKKDN